MSTLAAAMPEPEESPKPTPAARAAFVCAMFAAGVCLIVPLCMGSNIWPIAAVFWAVLACPVAAAVGALVGSATKGLSRGTARSVLAITGSALAVVLAIVMANNR